jgi:hypothetical protein
VTAPLADGPHEFRVRAEDAVGNADPTPAERTFNVDTQPPDTAILSGPTGTTSERDARFSFSGTQGNLFECSLDGSPFETCASPVKYPGLADGEHAFRVRTVDAAGNRDPSPALSLFAVDRHVSARLKPLKRRHRFKGKLRLPVSAAMFEPGRAVLRARFDIDGGARSLRASANYPAPGTRRLVLTASPAVNRALANELGSGPVDASVRGRFTDGSGNTRLVSRPVRLIP